MDSAVEDISTNTITFQGCLVASALKGEPFQKNLLEE